MKQIRKQGGLSFRQLFIFLVLSCLALFFHASPAPAVVIPDLSQTNNPAWVKYCAPTAATDALWVYGVSDAGLIQAGANNNQKADNTIAALAAPAYMNTNGVGGGTLVVNMVSGLQNYANFFSNNGAGYYTVSLLTAFNTGAGGGVGSGQTLWNAMATAFSNGEQVLPLISFTGPPVGQSDIESKNLDYEEGNPNPNGHVVAMTGSAGNTIQINDPGNNAGPIPQHNWLGENVFWNLNPALATSIGITSGAYNGNWIVGAVTMSAVPEPGSLLLIGSGLIGIIGLRRKFMG